MLKTFDELVPVSIVEEDTDFEELGVMSLKDMKLLPYV